MAIDLSILQPLDKLLFDIPLVPVQGKRFQPTGFPDLGAATYSTSEGTCLLVESAQSMANRLESTCWDEGKQTLLSDLDGLSYVRVNDKNGKFLTSSILEAHRINSVYIEKADKGDFHKMFEKEIDYSDSRPIDRAAFAKALLKFDTGSLVHGIFLESIGGRLRIARALSAFVEADGVGVAASGGVKNDHVMPGKDGEKSAGAGYANLPFHRDEYTAEKITLFANIDLAQIRGYGLGEEPTKLLTLLGLFKLRALLDGKLRFRTACDFKIAVDAVRATNVGLNLPAHAELLDGLKASIKACEPHFAKNNGVTTVTYAG